MANQKTAVLLINVGSPDAPNKKSVKRYLKEFLNDKMVIDLPWLFRKILVNGIIIPFRTKKSTALYSKIWTDEGSPLITNTRKLCDKLNAKDSNLCYYYAMRYGNPSIGKALDDIEKEEYSKLIIIPLYPQYAQSTTQTAVDKVLSEVNKRNILTDIKIIEQFYNHPAYISAISNKIKQYNTDDYDFVLFSYHGLPVSHINKIHRETKEKDCTCTNRMPSYGKKCYKACCYETTRRILKNLDITAYATAFQSRLSNKWLRPFTSDVLQSLADNKVKRILVAAPSFVSDCLETTIEIQDEYEDLFLSKGGEKLTLVKALNDSDEWAEAIMQMTEEVSA